MLVVMVMLVLLLLRIRLSVSVKKLVLFVINRFEYLDEWGFGWGSGGVGVKT